MTITTPSGHEVTIKDEVTFGDTRRIARIFLKGMRAGGAKQASLDDASVIQDAEDESIRVFVKQIKNSEGVIITNPDKILDQILSWPTTDAEMVLEAIENLTKPNKESPKAS